MKRSVLVPSLCALCVVHLASASSRILPVHEGATLQQAPGAALTDSIISLEKLSWAAWKARDSKFFEHFLSDDHVEIQSSGRATKAVVVAGVGSPACVVSSYGYDNFKLTLFARTVALVTYLPT